MRTYAFLIVMSLLVAVSIVRAETPFEDGFDGKLDPAWQWVREDSKEWRFCENQLQMRAQHGKIWGGNDAKNLLLVRPAKSHGVAASVSVAHQPTELWEQAGLLWYVDDDNFIKLISEHIKGEIFVVMAREQAGRGKVIAKLLVTSPDMDLRLKVEKTKVVALYRLKKDEAWTEAGACDFTAEGDKRFGLFSQNGPADKVHWIRYDNFSITEP